MRTLLPLLWFCVLGAGSLVPAAVSGSSYPPVIAGHRLVFPDDTGAHPDYRTEWWYVTGWLTDEAGVERGFQVTFFRVRTLIGEDSPSRFAPKQLLFAHAAVADPSVGRLLHAERVERAVAPLVGAETGRTNVWIDNWRFELQEDGRYVTVIVADDFALALDFEPPGPPVLNGRDGFSQKAPDPINASYYYSRPQLAVNGALSTGGSTRRVTGHAWLDHEWSSEILPEDASGWDWIGINLHDGGSLMAFQMRGERDGEAIWSSGTLRDGVGGKQILEPDEVAFEPGRIWVSPRTGARYPVEWSVTVADRRFDIVPLMDDQELDSSVSTGAVYWEGAVRLMEAGREVGQGYLEMTGYRERLRM